MYKVIEDKVILDGKEYQTYGIQCGDIYVKDVSADRAKVHELVEACNKFALEPIHLMDVIEDFLP